MKNNFRIRDGQHVIQESGMVIVGMGKKDVLDVLGRNACLLKPFQKVRIAFHVAGINQHISSFVQANEVVVGDPIAEVIDHCYLELNVPSGCSAFHCFSISDPGRV